MGCVITDGLCDRLRKVMKGCAMGDDGVCHPSQVKGWCATDGCVMDLRVR